jgi:hypothetical protein
LLPDYFGRSDSTHAAPKWRESSVLGRPPIEQVQIPAGHPAVIPGRWAGESPTTDPDRRDLLPDQAAAVADQAVVVLADDVVIVALGAEVVGDGPLPLGEEAVVVVALPAQQRMSPSKRRTACLVVS